MPAQKRFLTPAEVLERWSDVVVIGTLANWRHLDRGPPWQKLGAKVVYPIDLLEAWEKEHMPPANETKIQ